MVSDITWKIGGEAGFGIMSAGTIFAKAFSRVGYHVFATNEYPSLIRGGHNLITVRIAVEEFYSLHKGIDILVGLNAETVELHRNELRPGGVILYDPKDKEWADADVPERVHLMPLPLTDLRKEHGGDSIMRNTVAIGASLAAMGVDFSLLAEVIHDQFIRKGQQVVDENIASAKLGFEYVTEHFRDVKDTFLASTTKTTEQYILNASEAVGLGAIEAGMKFAAIYPMTPINSLIQLFADRAKDFGIVYKQPEDEIAGIMMAIGASIGGVRSMVASSGGGFALMVEGVSFAGIIEAPVVIDLGMRPGPATGMPTWTEQAELWMAIHAGHGEFPKIVLAAGDAAESYEQTIEAFELADEFQTPVIILTDKYINESQWCIPKSVFDKRAPMNRGKLLAGTDIPDAASFKRYEWSSEDGTSPRSIPGMVNGQHLVNSYEHDEKGWTIEDSDTRIKMANKRFRKTKAILAKMPLPKVYGDENADITFVAWGSTRGSILEAMKMLKNKGVTSKLIHFRWVYPLNESVIAPLLAGEKRIVDVENNGTAQLAEVIREETGVTIKEKLLKFDGRQWYPEEIVEQVMDR